MENVGQPTQKAATETTQTLMPADELGGQAGMETRERHPRLRSFARGAGALMGATGIMLATTAVACNPDPVTCELSAAAEGCWDLNTGVLRPNDGSGIERWTTGQILSGQAGLTKINGDVEITTNGTVFENKWVEGCIAVKANDVVIKNVLVRSDHNCAGGFNNNGNGIIDTGSYEGQTFPRPSNLLVADSVIIGNNPNADLGGIAQTDITAYGLDISGTTKGVRSVYKVNVSDSYMHDLATGTIHSEDWFMSTGPDDIPNGDAQINIVNNWMQANSDGANSGAIAFYNEYSGRDVSNINIQHNYLDGADNGVGFRGGAYINKFGNFYFHMTFKDNIIETNNAGQWTVEEVEAWCDSCPDMIWENNVNENGVPYPEPTPKVG